MRRTQEKFLEAMQERVPPRAKFCTLEAGESTIQQLRPEALRKMTASIKEREDKLCDP